MPTHPPPPRFRIIPPTAGGGGGYDEWAGPKAAANPQMYLRGLVWLVQMYVVGECPDYR